MIEFQEIERLKQELTQVLPNVFGRTKLSMISDFYSKLLKSDDTRLIEAYSLDFIYEYISELKLFTPYFLNPAYTDKLLDQLSKLKKVSILSQVESDFDDLIYTIKLKLNELNKILHGNCEKSRTQDLRFPLLESNNSVHQQESFGILESVNIKITESKRETRFVFVPSDKKVEARLLNQAKISYNIALNHFLGYNKIFKQQHEILIFFENLYAEYEGNSLGVGLTIGFIEQLSILYNLPYLTNIKNNIALTGGIDTEGVIIPVGQKAIKKKVDVVFFSDVEIFVFHKEDEPHARARLLELQLQFPLRKLSLITITEINDLINRRDLVDIKKQSFLIRSAKSLRKNWATAIITVFLIIILGLIYVRDFDDNPAYIEGEGQTMFVKNKSGKILWTKRITYFTEISLHITAPQHYHILADINNDGENEIIASQEAFPDSLSNLRGRIVCFDKYGNQLWYYVFKDTVSTKYETIETLYNSKLIGLIIEGKRKVVVGITTNGPNFPSAVFKLDASNGKRLKGTLWNPGHIMMGIIRKKDNGEHEIICNMINNDYEKVGIFGFDYKNLNGITPFKKDNYKLLGFNNAKLNFYIFVPRTDYSFLFNNRQNHLDNALFDNHRLDAIQFGTHEGQKIEEVASIGYEYSKKTGDINVIIQSHFRVRRDTLVAHGKLKTPYTDTPEYKALLKSQVLYWNGKEFVKRADLK